MIIIQKKKKRETKKPFNNLRNKFLKEEIRKHRKKIYKKEQVYNYLKGKDILTTTEKRVLKNIERYFKNLKKDLNKIKIYQYNTTSDIRNLMKSLKKIITSR